jgi:hypothetical protein
MPPPRILFVVLSFFFVSNLFAAPVDLSVGTAAHSTQNGGFSANLALDNIDNFTHTLGSDNSATWQVLLPANHSFTNITILNRGSCCQSRLRDITVQIVNFSGTVASDFTGGTVVYASSLLNPENNLSGPPSISTNAGGASGNMIRIKRTPDPDLSGSGGDGNADEANVLSMNKVTAEEQEGISSFTASATLIAPSAPIDLNWTVATSITALTINNGVGNVLPSTVNGTGGITLDPGPAVTTTYTLTATLPGGATETSNVAITAEPNPIISSFTADQTSIAYSGSATLTWAAGNYDTLTLNGVDVASLSTTPVSPLVTTTYTLVATNVAGSTSATVTIIVQNSADQLPANGRFVEVVKHDTVNSRLHISEIEVFNFGNTPNAADSDGTSTNDLIQNGPASIETPPTTTTLSHGLATSVLDGDLEAGAAVWTTGLNLGYEPRFMVDLGATEQIGTVRVFGRQDTCCTDRLSNFSINVYADNGSGQPGNLLSTAFYPGTAPAGSQGSVELDLSIPDPSIHSFTANKTLIPVGAPITLSWSINTAVTSVTIDNGIGDVSTLTDGSGNGSLTINTGPNMNTVYRLNVVRPNGVSSASVAVDVTDHPLIYSFTADNALVSSGTTVTLSWDVDNTTSLDLNGTDVTGLTGTTFQVNSNTTRTLTATNANGSTSQVISIRVIVPGQAIINEFLAANNAGLLDDTGAASDWIELHNPSNDPAPLDGFYLTDNISNLTKWRIPNVTLAPGAYLVVFASSQDRAIAGSELHTNFNLTNTGEYLALVKPDDVSIVSEFGTTYPQQRTDISYGFDPTAAGDGYFPTPTPGAANGSSFSDFVADTAFSLDRGFYTDPIQVAVTSPTLGAQIRYTLDGTKPTASTGFVYSAPVDINKTTVLRAAAFKPGFVPTNVDTHTYIFTADVIASPNMSTSITQNAVYGPQMNDSLRSIPTVSLSFLGDVERLEKEISIEMIGFPDGDSQLDAGMERFGSYVTDFAKRGMRVTFRNQYGPGKLTFPIFAGDQYNIPPAAQVDSIDLRAGNHDMVARGAYMSNRFTDDSMLDMGQIAPHGRFVHVYLNGNYWGQYHLRERWNAAMMTEYFGGVKDDYEAINANNAGDQFLTGEIFDGTGQYWQEAQTLLNTATPFSSARGHIDMANVFDFTLLWVSGNSESEFRAAGSVPLGVPFKFFMKDADGFLRPPGHAANHNGPLNIMTKLATEANTDYKILLADRIHKHFFNDGALTPAKNIARLQKRVDEVQLSFLSESARWGFRTPATWQSFQNDLINTQFPALTNTMIGQFQGAGMYPGIVAPSFNQHGGAVTPGFHLTISAPAGTIYYTTDGTDPRESVTSAIASTAIPYTGQIPISATTPVKSRIRTTNGNWSALNEASFFQDHSALVVSEVMYNPSSPTAAEIAAGFNDSEDFEFLELLNTGSGPIDLTGITFADGITFEYTATSIAAGARVLIVENTAAFQFRYGAGHPIVGQYIGKLKDEGELITLSSQNKSPIHSFTYSNLAPWPTSPAGNGYSLTLIAPDTLPDHNDPASWQASSTFGGTPGLPNADPQSYATWATTNLVTGSENDDDDHDGLSNLLEFLLISDPNAPSPNALPTGSVENNRLTLTLNHNLAAGAYTMSGDISTDLINWSPAVVESVTYHGDGTATTSLRSPTPVPGTTQQYIRARFQSAP